MLKHWDKHHFKEQDHEDLFLKTMLVDATSRRDINTVHKSHLSNKLIELPSYQLFHYVNQFEI